VALKELGDFIIAEINRNLDIIRQSDIESFDKFAVGKVKALVGLLDILDECQSEGEFKSRIKLMRNSHLGASAVLEEIIAKVDKS
jgi:hypothetical protein